jgi:hypothetical protein
MGRFVIEDWQHAGNSWAGSGPASQFFVIKVSGPPGRWPLKAYIMGPGVEDEGMCTPQEDELDLEFEDQAFIEMECPVDDPLPGRYTMRLVIAGEHVGDFPFVIRENGNGG